MQEKKATLNAMASPRNVIQEMFSSTLQHGAITSGNISSICIYPHTTNQGPQLSLVLSTSDGKTPQGNVSNKLLLPLRTSTLRELIGRDHSVTMIPARDLEFGNPKWNDWVAKTMFSKVRRDMGLDAREGPGGDTMIQLKELLLIGRGGGVVYRRRRPSRKGGIGHILITLPTKFAGSTVTFRHSNHPAKEFKLSTSSRSSYQAIAWYSDVEFNATPVTNGHLCAFVYTIYHKEIGPLSIPCLLPAADLLCTEKCFKYRVQHILRRWSQQCKQVAIAEISPGVGCSLKMIFPKGSDSSPTDVVSRLLVQVARKAGFGALHATLMFVQTRNASPGTVQLPSRGYYETWELNLGDGFIDRDEGIIRVDSEGSLPGINVTTADQALYTTLGGDWKTHIPTEVVGNIFDMSLCPSRKVSVDWDNVDFQTGKGPAFIEHVIPVIVLFPILPFELAFLDAGVPISPAKLYTTNDENIIDLED